MKGWFIYIPQHRITYPPCLFQMMYIIGWALGTAFSWRYPAPRLISLLRDACFKRLWILLGVQSNSLDWTPSWSSPSSSIERRMRASTGIMGVFWIIMSNNKPTRIIHHELMYFLAHASSRDMIYAHILVLI